MRSIRHWTPRYLVDRSTVLLYQAAFPHHPWLTRSAITFLDLWLQPGDNGFEFGSGRSTIWFAARGIKLVSVEHNAEWHERVTTILAKRDLNGLATALLRTDGVPEVASSSYVATLNSVPEESLDFCLIDGVTRDHCARNALLRIKPGGIIIVDNANWYLPRHLPSRAPGSRKYIDGYASAIWEDFGNQVANWRCLWSTNGEWDTAIWVKPSRQAGRL